MAYQYYFKKCGRQELGSVGINEKPHRGRYLLTSMNSEILSFFPPLSKTQLNDYYPVPCIPLFVQGKPKVYCNFVYHNDKFHGSTVAHPRNEYRLYLSKELEGGTHRLKENDILIFRKQNPADVHSSLYLFLVPPENAQLYSFCDKTIANSCFRGGYATYSGEIPEFEAEIPVSESTKVAVNPDVVQAVSQDKTKSKVESLFNQVMFRDFLLVGYEGLCAVTRTVIRHDPLINLEAAHIRPQAHRGNSLPSNGLLLCRDIHWAFDHGFIALSDDCKLLVHPESNSAFLSQYQNKKIFIPENSFFQPDVENIRWHRENVYGHFQTIREIVQ